jgi:glutamine amidotransferase
MIFILSPNLIEAQPFSGPKISQELSVEGLNLGRGGACPLWRRGRGLDFLGEVGYILLMCRIFGFRSVLSSRVHKSLLDADNALIQQSGEQPHGWGVAYYVAGAPHIVKSTEAALEDQLFTKVSGVVTSQTVLAHLRKATHGSVSILNTHPFQYGAWSFIHNGNIEDFASHRKELLARVSPNLRHFILGETDSELIFLLILTQLDKKIPLHEGVCSSKALKEAILESVDLICKLTGPIHKDSGGPDSKTNLTFVITDGSTMMGFHGGKDLYYSTHKTKCSEADTCAFYSPECEAPTPSGRVNHMIFSSEPLLGENVWNPMKPGEIIGVDQNMNLLKEKGK